MRAGKRDTVEGAIVFKLRDKGFGVKYMPIGAGFDLLVWNIFLDPKEKNVWLLEVKDPTRRRQLTRDEIRLHDQGCPIHVVCTPEEAYAVCGGFL